MTRELLRNTLVSLVLSGIFIPVMGGFRGWGIVLTIGSWLGVAVVGWLMYYLNKNS